MKDKSLEIHRTKLATLYNKLSQQSAPLTKAIIASLRFRGEVKILPQYGMKSGDLDDGSLYKLNFNEDHPAIFERPLIQTYPNLAVGLLVDQSGSMECNGVCQSGYPIKGSYHTLDGSRTNKELSRVYLAKLVAIAMANALKAVHGISFNVYGHEANHGCAYANTTDTPGDGVGTMNLYVYKSRTQRTNYSMSLMDSGGNNADGFAMEAAGRHLYSDYPDINRKFLIVISDGAPSAYGTEVSKRRTLSAGTKAEEGSAYSGSLAVKHMYSVCQWLQRRANMRTLGIGIGGSPCQETGEEMYGKGNYICLHDVLSSARIIAAFISKMARQL